MKPLSTAPASAHKLHRPQVFCVKDRPNDNYLEVTFFGEATGDDKLTVADLALAAYERALEPKRLALIPGGHFDPYLDQFPLAAAAATEWFREHLLNPGVNHS